jgi:hypothetical protein
VVESKHDLLSCYGIRHAISMVLLSFQSNSLPPKGKPSDLMGGIFLESRPNAFAVVYRGDLVPGLVPFASG